MCDGVLDVFTCGAPAIGGALPHPRPVTGDQVGRWLASCIELTCRACLFEMCLFIWPVFFTIVVVRVYDFAFFKAAAGWVRAYFHQPARG